MYTNDYFWYVGPVKLMTTNLLVNFCGELPGAGY